MNRLLSLIVVGMLVPLVGPFPFPVMPAAANHLSSFNCSPVSAPGSATLKMRCSITTAGCCGTIIFDTGDGAWGSLSDDAPAGGSAPLSDGRPFTWRRAPGVIDFTWFYTGIGVYTVQWGDCCPDFVGSFDWSVDNVQAANCDADANFNEFPDDLARCYPSVPTHRPPFATPDRCRPLTGADLVLTVRCTLGVRSAAWGISFELGNGQYVEVTPSSSPAQTLGTGFTWPSSLPFLWVVKPGGGSIDVDVTWFYVTTGTATYTVKWYTYETFGEFEVQVPIIPDPHDECSPTGAVIDMITEIVNEKVVFVSVDGREPANVPSNLPRKSYTTDTYHCVFPPDDGVPRTGQHVPVFEEGEEAQMLADLDPVTGEYADPSFSCDEQCSRDVAASSVSADQLKSQVTSASGPATASVPAHMELMVVPLSFADPNVPKHLERCNMVQMAVASVALFAETQVPFVPICVITTNPDYVFDSTDSGGVPALTTKQACERFHNWLNTDTRSWMMHTNHVATTWFQGLNHVGAACDPSPICNDCVTVQAEFRFGVIPAPPAAVAMHEIAHALGAVPDGKIHYPDDTWKRNVCFIVHLHPTWWPFIRNPHVHHYTSVMNYCYMMGGFLSFGIDHASRSIVKSTANMRKA